VRQIGATHMKPPPIPSAPERRRIAALAVMPERGVLRTYRDPGARAASTLERVKQAARELGLPEPQEPERRR